MESYGICNPSRLIFLFSLSITPLRWIQDAACINPFLLMNSTIPLYAWTWLYLNTYPLEDIWDIASILPLWKKLWTFMYRSFCEHNFSCLWIKCSRVQLLNHMVSTHLCWFKKKQLPKSFPEWLYQFTYNYQQCMRNSASPHLRQHIWFFILPGLMGVWWCLIVVLHLFLFLKKKLSFLHI